MPLYPSQMTMGHEKSHDTRANRFLAEIFCPAGLRVDFAGKN
jgi:hypothetical protein